MSELVFENYIKRLLVTAKKRYVMLTEDDKGKVNIISKGIESVRRDWCDYATDAQDVALELLMYEDNVAIGVDKVIKYIVGEAEKLRRGKASISKLVLSKKLSKPFTSYDAKAIHVMVAKRMVARGKKVEIGDRIQYLIMNNGKKLISEKAEEADYVMDGKSEFGIDYDYYIYYQLVPPVGRILEVLGIRSDVLLQDKRQKSLADY